jgi:arginine decarboxylase-like protein
MSPMPHSTQTWVFQLFKKSSTAGVPSTVHDYNPTRTRYFNSFHGILSYADRNDGGQLTYNMMHEISSLDYRDQHMRANAWEEIRKELKIKCKT